MATEYGYRAKDGQVKWMGYIRESAESVARFNGGALVAREVYQTLHGPRCHSE